MLLHVGEASSMGRVLTPLLQLKENCLDVLCSRFARWTKPLRTSLPLSTLSDLGRSKSQLIAENALLRQQLIILRREVKRPPLTRTDRMLLVLLVRLVRTWQQALLIVQPDTLLRWHRELFRLVWKRKSKTASHCSGYLGHPFKNKPFETEKDLLPLLANTGGWVYHPKSSPADSCSNDDTLTG